MGASLLKKIELESGLELQIFDVSRRLAGDRWYVGFAAQVEIPMAFLANRADSAEIDIEKMKAALGETVRFEQKRERHYIDEKEKDSVLESLMRNFLDSTLQYLSAKDFAKKYALKVYKKEIEKASWYKT